MIEILTSPWAIEPRKLLEIKSMYEAHIKGPDFNFRKVNEAIARKSGQKGQGVEIQNGVAIILVDGPIAKRLNVFGEIFGWVSSELLIRDVKKALNDDSVGSILLDIDSPGGTVDGTFEIANMIFNSRGNKPIVAFTDGMMASAAYWIGAAADKIFISGKTVRVGSIGVVATHTDFSEAEKKAGIKTTEITSGKFKIIASPHSPLTKAGRASVQEDLDFLYSVFVMDIATFRGVSVEAVLEDMADGRIFIGENALKAGLVDGVFTRDQLLEDMANGDLVLEKHRESNINLKKEVEKMDINTLKEKHPDLVAQIKVEGVAENINNLREVNLKLVEDAKIVGHDQGKIVGAQAEMQRIKDVEAQSKGLAGHEKLVLELKYDGKTTGPEAAVQILAAERAKLALISTNIQDDAPPVLDSPPSDDLQSVPRETKGDEASCKKVWDKNPRNKNGVALQNEFTSFESYYAYEKNKSEGRANIYGSEAIK